MVELVVGLFLLIPPGLDILETLEKSLKSR